MSVVRAWFRHGSGHHLLHAGQQHPRHSTCNGSLQLCDVLISTAMFRTQVLSPMKKGPAGTRSLNTALQALLNPPAPGKQQVQRRGMEATAVFRVGDRVIQVTTQELSMAARREHCIKALLRAPIYAGQEVDPGLPISCGATNCWLDSSRSSHASSVLPEG